MNLAGKTVAILVAAGMSTRMGIQKLTLNICGKTPLEMSLERLLDSGSGIDSAVIAVSDSTRELGNAMRERFGTRVCVVEGGDTRGESVYNALCAVRGADIVAIHDAARCLVPVSVIRACIDSAREYGSGAAAARVRDTVRDTDGNTLNRDSLLLVQTPQAFSFKRICDAYTLARKNGTCATDDCAIYSAAGYEVHYVEGSIVNQKLTYLDDVPYFQSVAYSGDNRVGIGEDTHRLEAGRRLVLGGVDIPYQLGLLGHSDADVLTHAIVDALLGAASLGDIGKLFPDNDEKYKDICSIDLLKSVGALLRERGFCINNIDSTVIAQKPKIAPYSDTMRENIAFALQIEKEHISVKATTSEGMNDEGRQLCISARAICSLRK